MRKSGKPILILVGLGLLFIISIKFWLGPAITKKQCKSAILSVWKGDVEIEDINFNLTAPIYIKDLKLVDNKGNCWMYISQAKATLTDRWMLKPKLSELEIERLELKTHFTDEKHDIALYIHKSPEGKKLSRLDLKKLDIKSISVTTDINSGRRETVGNTTLSAVRKPRSDIFEGFLVCENVDLVELTNALQTKAKFTRGKISAHYNFTITSADTSTLRGNGLIIIDDADLIAVPLIKSLFNTIGLTKFDPLQMSDSLILFGNSGSLVTIEKARISNPLAAIQAEPGGSVDIKSRQIDFYVVTSLLSDIEGLIGDVPFMNLFVVLKDKLTRLHVKGKWDDPPAKLIKKEPLEDIKEATVEFFSGTIKNSGQITDDTINAVKEVFKQKPQNEK